jgi:hypothetical protein
MLRRTESGDSSRRLSEPTEDKARKASYRDLGRIWAVVEEMSLTYGDDVWRKAVD